MEDHGNQEPAFLFVNAFGSLRSKGPDERTKRHIRRHIMRDAGKSRRKVSCNPRFALAIEMPETTKISTAEPISSEMVIHSRPPPQHVTQENHTRVALPFWEQNPFVMVNNSLVMDPFAPYGFALVSSGESHSSATTDDSFWFPFAFKTSELLQRLFAHPEMLARLHSHPKDKVAAIALTRLTDVLNCIKGSLANPDIERATASNVLRAVLATICYNYVNRDYLQAAMHLEGLHQMISARGGIESLSADHELRLMIFWVDVTTALISDQSPRFAMPLYLIPPLIHRRKYAPFDAVFDYLNTSNPGASTSNPSIAASLKDISIITLTIETELAIRGDDLWSDEIFLGLRVNPVAHRLLDTPAIDADISKCTVLEAARLGAVLFIIWVKQRSRTYPGCHTASYWSSLLNILGATATKTETPMLTVTSLTSFNLWLLILCSITTRNSAHQEAALKLIARIEVEQNIPSWDTTMAMARSMPLTSNMVAQCSQVKHRIENT